MSFLSDFEWFVQGEKRLATPSVRSYCSDLRVWQELGFDLEAMNPPSSQDLSRCLRALEFRQEKNSTDQRRRVALRAFIRFRAFQNISWLDLLEHLPIKTQKDILPKALSAQEVKQFVELPVVMGVAETFRDRALFELMYASGLRVSEACQLRWGDIDERGLVLRVAGKGEKDRLVPTTDRAFNLLKEYRLYAWEHWSQKARHSDKDIVFLSRRSKALTRMAVWKIFRKRSLALEGFTMVHPHVLRHSFATHLLQGGADVRFVQALLGHSSINTTERYLKIETHELQKLFEEFHPLG